MNARNDDSLADWLVTTLFQSKSAGSSTLCPRLKTGKEFADAPVGRR